MNKRQNKEKNEEKIKNYKLMISGTIIFAIGFTLIVIGMCIIKTPSFKISAYALGGMLAVIGTNIDIVGKITITKENEKPKNKKGNKHESNN